MGTRTKRKYYKRILVISNNPFSNIQHNGKTLASFFESYPADNIAQLYFNPMTPDNIIFNKYFRISDIDILKKLIGKSTKCGESVYPVECDTVSELSSVFSKISRTYSTRLLRDLMWKNRRWNTEELNQWLDEFSPDIVFFLAGDSNFTYDICAYVVDKYKAKLVVYMTDDYVLPRYEISPFFWIRKSYLLKRMKKVITRSDLFITISEEMRKIYKELLNKDSIQAINMCESLYDPQNYNNRDIVLFVYAGGLHYNRDKTLHLLANAIQNHNINSIGKKAFLRIYSTQSLSQKTLNRLNIEGASKFCGGLNKAAVKTVLNNCDIPVHVESFNKSSIASTRLSISTKIPEYMSLKKCILAIGPKNIASMRYLADCSYCITEKRLISDKLEFLLQDESMQNEYSALSYDKYMLYHTKTVAADNFVKKITEL